MATTIYYFSGTGNSLKVARMLEKELEECELIPMARLWKLDRIIAPAGSVGFIFPMYTYGLPDIVERFVRKIEIDRAEYLFAVVTRGGAQGCALQRIEEILLRRSHVLDSGYYVDMPSNYIPLHEIDSKEKQKKTFKSAEKKMRKVVKTIRNRRTKGDKDRILVRKFAQRDNKTFREHVNLKDENFEVDRNCISCGFCARICPVDNIIMMNGMPIWQHHCQSCLACLHFCPKEAIQYKKKTIGRKRYHHPDVTFKDIEAQKQRVVAKKIAKKMPVGKRAMGMKLAKEPVTVKVNGGAEVENIEEGTGTD